MNVMNVMNAMNATNARHACERSHDAQRGTDGNGRLPVVAHVFHRFIIGRGAVERAR
jgi:hypothetical protein